MHCSLWNTVISSRAGLWLDWAQILTDLCFKCLLPSEFPQVKLPTVTDLTWEGKRDTWLPALYSALVCAPLLCSSPLTQLCCLLNWFNKFTQQKTCHGVVVFSLYGLSVREKKTRGTGQEGKYWRIKNQRGWLGGTQLHGRDGAQQKWLKPKVKTSDSPGIFCHSRVVSPWAFGGDVQGACCGQTLPWVRGACTAFLCDAENISITGGKGVLQ